MEEGFGGGAVDVTGGPYPESTQKLARAADAVLLGAVGGPQWDTLPREKRPERGLLGIRKDLNLFANPPAILYPELANASTLKPEVVAGLDILIVRELTGDIYFGQPRGVREENENVSVSIRWCIANQKFVVLAMSHFRRHKSVIKTFALSTR